MEHSHDGQGHDSLAARLAAVQQEIVAACQRVARDPADVTLIAVSKTFSWEEILPAYRLGIRHFGENYMQDALQKISLSATYPDLCWHFIGHLQRNKVRFWSSRFHLFHCLDSVALARLLQKKAEQDQVVTSVLLQVKLGDEVSKSGVLPAELPFFMEELAGFPRLSVGGLMTIPPFTVDPEQGRAYYQQLRNLRDRLVARGLADQRVFRHLSMGMSHDFVVAVEEGATMVRVGSAIFGPRQR
ncbi:MAG: YggS family pyridoxal phosphate-dependent enzyme [Deltaproteobacteria bacterium]|nr:YggS family pyridoxal phosphate-dependent enzyme [Candidatus Anaeroferrophillus wilburensis]MBN2888676.1 YggS family pyridoxal phosphate-dependent enzyme [Deltaproteobacteria bacterium]